MKYSRTTMALAVAGALALTSTLVACGDDKKESADTNAAVTLNVVGLLPGAKPEAQTALAAEVTDFQKDNPNITVKTQDYEWKATTFAAELAGGTLPTVFEIPFTDAQDADRATARSPTCTTYVEAAAVRRRTSTRTCCSTARARTVTIYAIPAKSVYAIGLHYNRDLFTAGRARPGQAADDLGRGPRRRQDHRREDRHGRLRPDGAWTTPAAGS